MQRLFLKIFLWFWATVIIIGVTLVLSFVLAPKGSYMPWQNMQSIATSITREMDRHGSAGAAALLTSFEESQHLEACLYDQNATPVTGNRCASFQEMAKNAAHSVGPDAGPDPGTDGAPHASVYRSLLRIRNKEGKQYILATELPYGPDAVHRTVISFILHWILMLLVSSGVCYLLTLRLTQPIHRLREASKQIADGNLGARVGAGVEKRGDEFGDLARDFNAMAGRIDGLVSSQRQLISDVSHELRSPLTRINLALDLARGRLGQDPAFDHMSGDLEKLNDMIGRLLTVARLDSCAVQVTWTVVDLGRLVAEIVDDAELEARERRCTVVCECTGEHQVTGDESLLRSAIENVVRNAVYYTETDTEIRVDLASVSESAGKLILLRVIDRGPGVPEADTENIFKPFYRVADARDRQSGGAGLGLAIASRVVALHRGRIRASNCGNGGLEVRIELPAA